MTIGAQFATRSEVEALRRKWERAVSGASIVQHGPDIDSITQFINLADVPKTYVAAGNWVVRVKSTVDALEFADLKGTTNQVTVTENAADFTLSLPQDIHTGASPTFVTAKLSALTDGYIPYHVSDATGLADSVIRTDGTLVGVGMLPTVAQLEVNTSQIITSTTAAPYLKIVNLSDTARDPIIQYAIGATPITRWTHGLDDSLSNDWLLCAGDILTDTASDEIYGLMYTYDEYLMIADSVNDRIKRHLSIDGTYSAKIGTDGTGDTNFNTPWDICSDGTHVYVTDSANNRIKKHKLSDMSFVLEFGTVGAGDDQFLTPRGICTDGVYLYIVDSGNSRIKKHKCSDLTYVAKSATAGEFSYSQTICTDGTFVYLARMSFGVAKCKCSDLSFVISVTADGHIDSAQIQGICTTGGYLYLANANLPAILGLFFKYTCSNLTWISTFGTVGTGDGECISPNGLDTDGIHLFVADGHRIQSLLLNGTFVWKFGSQGVGDDQFDIPRGLCVSGTVTLGMMEVLHAPILRAKADGSACESYVSFQLRDEIRFLEDSIANANYIAMQAPASVTSYKLILPGAAAGAKKHLYSSATNILDWGQNVDTDGTPIFVALNLSATSNQIVLQSAGVTGTITATPASSNKVWTLQDVTGTIYQTGGTDVAVADGGTGASTLADGGLVIGNAAGAVEVVAAGLTTQILVGGGAATAPVWGTDIPTAVTIGTKYIYRADGTDVPVADGGTGKSSFTQYAIPYASAATTIGEIAIGTAGQVLAVNVGANGYTWIASGGALALDDLTDVDAASPSDHDIIQYHTGTGWVHGALPAGSNHEILSATHSDSTADTVVRGDIIIGSTATPKWTRLAKGTATHILTMGADEPTWAAPTAGGGGDFLVCQVFS